MPHPADFVDATVRGDTVADKCEPAFVQAVLPPCQLRSLPNPPER